MSAFQLHSMDPDDIVKLSFLLIGCTADLWFLFSYDDSTAYLKIIAFAYVCNDIRLLSLLYSIDRWPRHKCGYLLYHLPNDGSRDSTMTFRLPSYYTATMSKFEPFQIENRPHPGWTSVLTSSASVEDQGPLWRRIATPSFRHRNPHTKPDSTSELRQYETECQRRSVLHSTFVLGTFRGISFRADDLPRLQRQRHVSPGGEPVSSRNSHLLKVSMSRQIHFEVWQH